MTATYIDEPTSPPPFGWLSSIGMALLSFFARPDDPPGRPKSGGYGGGTTGRPDPCKGPITSIKCCHLACPDRECPYENNRANFKCPEGYIKTYWTCTEGSNTIGCGECASGDSCVDGPWYCSIWFYIEEVA
jgi:hypothetical protein